MGLMILGVALLTALHLLHLTFVNMLLLIPLLLILAGAVLHVLAMKRETVRKQESETPRP